MTLCSFVACSVLFLLAKADVRRPANDVELKNWLENMVVYHRFSKGEVSAATGLSETEVEAALQRFHVRSENRPKHNPRDPLTVLPYPGGRHPRIGFLDGAIDPQRETKLSIFTPWDEASYVVADVPEAIWSNLGLTYLAHTHVPTIWTKQSVELPPLEWKRRANGDYQVERALPNGISFGTLAHAARQMVFMTLWLSNGTSQVLSDLRVQNCVMLKGAVGFDQQSNSNKVLHAPFAACRGVSGDRWVITAWKPVDRSWANAPVPCLHADPKFSDTKPGDTSTLQGFVSFFIGSDIEAEFRRLDLLWQPGEWPKR